MNSNQILLKNLKTALTDDSTLLAAREDFAKTFQRLGIHNNELMNGHALASCVLSYIYKALAIEEAEERIKNFFLLQMYHGKNVFELIQLGLQQRFEIIFNQLNPHLKGVSNALDYGCGSGVLTQMIHDRCGIDIDGIDVRDFRTVNVSVPIGLYVAWRSA